MGHWLSALRFPSCGSFTASLSLFSKKSSDGSICSQPSGFGLLPTRTRHDMSAGRTTAAAQQGSRLSITRHGFSMAFRQRMAYRVAKTVESIVSAHKAKGPLEPAIVLSTRKPPRRQQHAAVGEVRAATQLAALRATATPHACPSNLGSRALSPARSRARARRLWRKWRSVSGACRQCSTRSSRCRRRPAPSSTRPWTWLCTSTPTSSAQTSARAASSRCRTGWARCAAAAAPAPLLAQLMPFAPSS